MPQTSYTAFDTGGQTKLTDMDMLAEQRRREMSDQTFRSALLNNQNGMQREGWGRQDALAARNLGAQERISQGNNATQLAMGGSFQDRTAANQQMAQMQMRPAQTMADLEASKWNEGAGLRGSQNALTQEVNGAKLSALRGGLSGQGANPRLAAALMGINPEQLEDPTDRMLKAALAQRFAAGELDAGQFKAAASGDYSGLPRKQVSAIAPEQQIAGLQGDVERFGQKDAATFGFDPVEDDVTRIISQRDQVAQALKAQRPQLSPEQAMEGANFYIEESLKKNGTDQRWGTEWIAKLRQALRSGGAPAAPQRTMADVDSFQGGGL